MCQQNRLKKATFAKSKTDAVAWLRHRRQPMMWGDRRVCENYRCHVTSHRLLAYLVIRGLKKQHPLTFQGCIGGGVVIFPGGIELQQQIAPWLAWKCLSRPLFRRTISTRKVGHIDLVFGMRSGFISICLCMQYEHVYSSNMTARQTESQKTCKPIYAIRRHNIDTHSLKINNNAGKN